MTSYAIGRLVRSPQNNRTTRWLARYGPPVLLLSWIPLVGDALCVASGWMRQNVFAAAIFVALGKFARYVLVAKGVAFVAADDVTGNGECASRWDRSSKTDRSDL